jgi:lysophospholipase L1-like esterase
MLIALRVTHIARAGNLAPSMHLRHRSLLSFALIALAAVPAFAQTAPTTAPTTQAFDVRPLTVRDGIGNAYAKLKAGKQVTVAFLGGPVTAGGGVRGYAALVVRGLQTQFPGSRIRLVNAGLVDGGSPLGAARYERDVLPHKPDLLFVEFAVDDAGKEDRIWHIERLVHKAWTADPTLDIVMLYGVHESQRADYAAKRLPPSAAAFEQVAKRYGIPSIPMGIDIMTRVESGKARWTDFFYDAWRPMPAAHTAYADAVLTALQALMTGEPPPELVKHALPAPMAGNLMLQPTTRRATTMPAPTPMTDAAGATAKATYVMPLVGTHWVNSPEFADGNGKILWRLFTQPAAANGRRLNDGFGVDRTRWGPPMQWFNEWRHFTGPAGLSLIRSTAVDKPNDLAARENDLPIVTFTAPQAGRYVVRVKAKEVMVYGLHSAIALNVVHFPAGQPKGKSIAFHRTQRGIVETPNIDVEVRLNEGDDVAFELDTNAIGGGGAAVYREAEITVGWFGQ